RVTTVITIITVLPLLDTITEAVMATGTGTDTVIIVTTTDAPRWASVYVVSLALGNAVTIPHTIPRTTKQSPQTALGGSWVVLEDAFMSMRVRERRWIDVAGGLYDTDAGFAQTDLKKKKIRSLSDSFIFHDPIS
ncbi:hypothetical protein V5O48_008029, partial [Marasmius crinis-equi]